MFLVGCTAYCVCVRILTFRLLFFLLHGSVPHPPPPHLNSAISNHPVALLKAKTDVGYGASLLVSSGITRRVGDMVLEDY